MSSKIDWAAVAAEESEPAQESISAGGVILPMHTTGNHLRCWIKLIGEPPQILYETPAVAMTRWMAFVNNPEQEVAVFHEHAFGQAIFFTRDAINQIAYFQVTYPTTEQGRTTPGSIWAGECRCYRYGGPCPKKP